VTDQDQETSPLLIPVTSEIMVGYGTYSCHRS
jgi:hypothetical protein